MKLDLLQVGMKYKYQQLCEAFDLKPATGNTKKKHMTTFERLTDEELALITKFRESKEK